MSGEVTPNRILIRIHSAWPVLNIGLAARPLDQKHQDGRCLRAPAEVLLFSVRSYVSSLFNTPPGVHARRVRVPAPPHVPAEFVPLPESDTAPDVVTLRPDGDSAADDLPGRRVGQLMALPE